MLWWQVIIEEFCSICSLQVEEQYIIAPEMYSILEVCYKHTG